MENTPKFRLRLNLFDGIVLLAAVAVAALLLWNALKPEPAAQDVPAPRTSTVRYIVCVRRFPEGVGSVIQVGDKLVDNIKNYAMGQVVATEIVPSTTLVMDHEAGEYRLAEAAGYEDILVTVESTCPDSEEDIVLDGGYTVRVGLTTYIRGEGYMASGPVVAIEREGQA